MRNAFAAKITELAEQDSRIVLLSGDIGNRLFDTYKKKFPDRFYNCGVAEANMISMAAGMALDGLRPFAYTITPFLTSRCYEQIKIDLCYQNLPVTLVGVGSGLSYAELGPTHHSFEDMAILRALPGMAVLSPADSLEVGATMEAALGGTQPSYIRLGKKGEPVIHQTPPRIGLGKNQLLREGKTVCIWAAGPILGEALAAAEKLEKEQGLSVAVVSHPSVKPLDEGLLSKWAKPDCLWVTVEEHSSIGGLGSALAEWLADRLAAGPPLLRIGVPDAFYCQGGSQTEARRTLSMDSLSIAARINAVWKQKK